MGGLMTKKNLKVLGVVVAFLLSFPFHFLYKWFPCFFTSIMFPINESIMEHMKILFGCIIFSGVVQKVVLILRKEKVNNVCFSNFIGAVVSIPIFLVMFLPFYYFVGENMTVTLLMMFLTIVICEYISYVIMNRDDYGFENKTIFFVVMVYGVFAFLTYYFY